MAHHNYQKQDDRRGSSFIGGLAYFASVQIAYFTIAAIIGVVGLFCLISWGLYSWFLHPDINFGHGVNKWSFTAAFLGIYYLISVCTLCFFLMCLSLMPALFTALAFGLGQKHFPQMQLPRSWPMVGITVTLVFTSILFVPLSVVTLLTILIGAQVFRSFQNPRLWPFVPLVARFMFGYFESSPVSNSPFFYGGTAVAILFGAIGGHYCGRYIFKFAAA